MSQGVQGKSGWVSCGLAVGLFAATVATGATGTLIAQEQQNPAGPRKPAVAGITSAKGSEPGKDSPVWRVLELGKQPQDARLAAQRTYNDKYHPWHPPATIEEWEKEREAIRERILVSQGLWPLPPMPELKPVIHGRIDRGEYTIEKVYFATHPGHYVTGNLYRPKNRTGRLPGILNPHGHWPNGRFYDLADDKKRQAQLDKGAEKFESGARYPLQARMVHLVRMGCVVFHYDMVGYADSKPITHRAGFTDATSQLWLQDFMGLQTYNSIRALDFLMSLPDVDPQRIGVTGASGGGTQTFMLCAIDPRPAAAFPAVMVSADMQGGCICENSSYLRIGINNVAIAGLFAPKPLGMAAALDWTRDIETKGLPELQRIYSFYGQTDHVHAKAYPQFDHNYNQVSREMMYAWFSKHLKLGAAEPVVERPFEPVSPAELSVWTDAHPIPADFVPADKLRDYLTKVAQTQFAALLPKDSAGVEKYRQTIGTAARVMLDGGVPDADLVRPVTPLVVSDLNGVRLYKTSISRRGASEQIPVVALIPANFNGTGVLWIDGVGKSHLFDQQGEPADVVKTLLGQGMGVISADVFQTGEFLKDGKSVAAQPINAQFPGYTFCYNRPLVAQRVHDILTVLGGLNKVLVFRQVHLIGTGEAGPWVLLARSVAGDRVGQCVTDLGGFGFRQVQEATHPMMLPGALKYGGIGGLAALVAPAEITIAGVEGVDEQELRPLATVYAAAQSSGKLHLQKAPLSRKNAVDQLLQSAR